MLNIKAAAVAVALAFAGSAFAQAPTPAKDPAATPGIDKRQVNQQKRIGAGVSSGQLTSKEATHLEKRETKLQNDKQKAKADGVVTKQERKHLQHEASNNSKAIAKQKHDVQHN